MIASSILLFVLSGKRILHIRDKVNEAQNNESHARKHRKNSTPSLRRYAWPVRASDTEANQNSDLSTSMPGTSEEEYSIDPTAPDQHEPHRLTSTRTESAKSSAATIPRTSFDSGTAFGGQTLRRRSTRFETMHWKYAKFAILCTLVLLVTWIPISINRIYNNFIRPDNPIYGLYFASALCIPLHGFGNFIIYVNTSWAECKCFVMKFMPARRKVQSQGSITADDTR